MKKYAKKYEAEDQALEQKRGDAAAAERRKKREQWKRYVSEPCCCRV